jgi:prepilin-type processing-associated H-X9-DG protein
MTRRDGFTLIELWAVVSINLLLAAALYPLFAQARESASRNTCLSNLRQLSAAHHLYVQDYDEVLPAWFVPGANGLVTWPVFFRGYIRDPRILRQGFVPPVEMILSPCLADYVLLTWGPTGDGTRSAPYSRWPGSVWREAEAPRPMLLAEVRRSAETVQFADGFTCIEETAIASQHREDALQVAFVDGHAGWLSHQEWRQVDQDDQGYFRHLGAADR